MRVTGGCAKASSASRRNLPSLGFAQVLLPVEPAAADAIPRPAVGGALSYPDAGGAAASVLPRGVGLVRLAAREKLSHVDGIERVLSATEVARDRHGRQFGDDRIDFLAPE